MLTKKTVFVCLLLHVLGCFAGDYSDLQALDVTCKGRDSCANLSEPVDFFKRNCECDRLCGSFGDCCIDASSAARYRNRFLSCMAFGKKPNHGGYVISDCPRRTVGPDAAACLSNDLSDPQLAAPVSTPGGATYRNVHCAACHGADLAELVRWPVLMNCETLAPHNLSADFVWEGLERDEYEEWGVQFQGQFHVCDVLFDKPEEVHNVRLCRADVVSTCPDDWRRAAVRRLCESYTDVMHTVDASYRNPHCALCNNETTDNLVCDRSELIFRRWKPFSFALLLDVNRSDGDHVGVKNMCPRDQKYDHFFKKCRNLVCAIPGYQMVREKCVKESEPLLPGKKAINSNY